MAVSADVVDQSYWDWTDFKFAVLVLAVPVQYLLTKSTSEIDRQYALNRVITTISEFKKQFLNLNHLVTWCKQVLFPLSEGDTEPPEEVRKLQQNDDGLYGTSDEERNPRPPHVKFRVGQVVKHKLHGYKGVIVGWDETAKAPEAWLNKMHPKDKPHWRQNPNYAVLIDTRDRLAPQMAYVVEENIEVITNTKIFHPLIEHYFETFDGAQYLPRPWLRKVYPYG